MKSLFLTGDSGFVGSNLIKLFYSIYEIIIFQVGYANNTSNPLNKILFYNNKTNEVITNNKVKNFSFSF